MEYSPPPFFKRGPSLLTRFTFFSILSVVLLVADARFNYLQSCGRASRPWSTRCSGWLRCRASWLAASASFS